VVSASYAGSRGVKLFGANYDLNQLNPAQFKLGLALQDQVPNPFAGQIKAGALAGNTVSRSQLLLPYPDYLGMMTLSNHGASSIYHSLQLTGERRYFNGISALVSYTFGKLIDDSTSNANTGATDADFRIGLYNRRLERSLDAFDITHRLVASGLWELPFLQHSKSLAGRLLGGWQINGIMTLQGGMPLIVRGANNFTGINWPDVQRDPTLPSGERSVTRWFDTDAFRNPAPFTIGNTPRTQPNARRPGIQDLSLSLLKSFRIAERFGMELRAELFNALNHVNYNDPNSTFSPNAQGVNVNAQFGRITSSLDPRRLQLGARLEW
jgi:hypothetical protein